MTPNPQTGLVDVLDLGPTEPTKGREPGPPLLIKMWPVDAKETFLRGGKLKDDVSPRYVLAENYKPKAAESSVAPDPA